MHTPDPEIPNIPNTPELGRQLSSGPALPVVLFPVRLETRFFPHPAGGFELRVRVYPDQVHIDSHEPALTADELTWGKHFWEETWRAGRDEAGVIDKERAKAAWRQLADRFDPPRAAWVAHALRPENPDDSPKTPIAPDDSMPNPVRFPSPETKPEPWTRAPHTRVLPNQWNVLGYKDGRLVVNVQGGMIRDPLATGPDPSLSAKVDPMGIDEGMRWMVDFEEAEEAGMGIRARLTTDEAAAGLDFLLVLGIKDSPDATTELTPRLAELFNGHHYTDGLSFIAQGTPTNNTQDAPSGFSSQDPGHEESYQAERTGLAFELGDGSNADVLTTALGLANAGAVFANLPNAAAKESLDAQHMNRALWEATWGYFLFQMIGGGGVDESPPTDGDIAWARSHFVDYVRANSPLPAIRVGKQPYGILPITSLNAWKPHPGQESQSGRDVALRDFLIRLRDLWRRNIPDAPRLGRSEEIDQETGIDRDLAEVLSMDGLSSSYSIRHVMGRHYLEHMWVFMAADFFLSLSIPAQTRAQITHAQFRAWFSRQEALAGAVLQTLGVPSRPRLAHAVFSPPAAGLRSALVQADHSPVLSPNYIESFLAVRDLGAIQKETIQQPPPHTLLSLLLRHSMLLEYAAAGSRLLIRRNLLESRFRREPELVGFSLDQAEQAPQHILRRMEIKITVQDQAEPIELGRYLLPITDSGKPDVDREPDLQPLSEFRDSLAHLSKLDVARLEHLLTGTLDLCSHRLDAWITSFATKRLDEMRKASPNGALLGGYGWVMNLKPAAAQTEAGPVPGEAGTIFQSATNPGFVHTPSLTQAATAAVLRSGHLAHSGEQAPDDLLAIDLSSERVRLAIWLLDGVRQGQPLAALLGYRLERGLHLRGLDQFIAVFRRIAPFGELLKAQTVCDDAEAEAARIAALPHPDLPAAQADLAAAKQQKADLLTRQGKLGLEIAAAERRAKKASENMAKAQDEIDEQDAIVHSDPPLPPFQIAEARKKLQKAKADHAKFQTDHDNAVASATQARGELTTVNAQIPEVDNTVSKLEIRVHDLEGPGKHPDFPAAQQAAEAAAARYQELIEQHRRRLQLPGSADQQTMESVAEIQVVDGLALLKLLKDGDITFGKNGLPDPDTDQQKALSKELDALADAVDAVSDALMAESVYQAVRGNSLRAASTVESIAGGETPPPELEVVRTPRTGIALTHRLVTLFSGEPALPVTWAPPLIPFRANAEPHLNAWVARLLGNPAKVRCIVERLEPTTGEVIESQEVRLSELRMAPLDFVYSVEGGQGGQQAEIEQRILFRIIRKQGGFPPGSLLRINPGRKPDWRADELGYDEFGELLRAVRKLIGSVRGIDGDDLNLPERSASPGVNIDDLETRAATAEQALHRCRNDLKSQVAQSATVNLQGLRDLILRAASFGIAGAVPLSAAGDSPADRQTLLAQASSIEKDLEQREKQLTDLKAGAGTPESQRDHAQARLRIVFGRAFVVLPRFAAADPGELEKALADSLKVQDADPLAAITWFQRMARVRDGVGRLDDVLGYAEALGNGEKLKLSIAQLPYKGDDRWVGLPLLPGTSLPGGKLSLAVQSVAPVDVHQPVAGLLVDEWVEVVPSATETTGIAFQYDQPNAAPPQAILIAVPPEVDVPWTVWSLQQVLLETLDLARIRAVDPDALDEIGHYLPALYFAFNTAGDTVSTDFIAIK